MAGVCLQGWSLVGLCPPGRRLGLLRSTIVDTYLTPRGFPPVDGLHDPQCEHPIGDRARPPHASLFQPRLHHPRIVLSMVPLAIGQPRARTLRSAICAPRVARYCHARSCASSAGNAGSAASTVSRIAVSQRMPLDSESGLRRVRLLARHCGDSDGLGGGGKRDIDHPVR